MSKFKFNILKCFIRVIAQDLFDVKRVKVLILLAVTKQSSHELRINNIANVHNWSAYFELFNRFLIDSPSNQFLRVFHQFDLFTTEID